MSHFQKQLSSFKLTWSLGLILRSALTLLSAGSLFLLIVGLADVLFAFSQAARELLHSTLLVILSLASLYLILRPLLLKKSQVADLADEQLEAGSVRSALDLQQQESSSELHAYLKDKALNNAGEALQAIPLKKRFPRKPLLVACGALSLTAIIIFTTKALQPEAFRVVSARLFSPEKDVAPYTLLRFSLTTEKEQTLYAGENSITATITGDEIDAPVYCLIRDPQTGDIEQADTFQQDDTTFTKKLNNVTRDLEIAFTCGNARSQWLPINVMLQPKVTTAEVTVTPPAYTAKPTQSYPLEGNTIQVLAGSKIELTVSSNRPLSGGFIDINTLGDEQEPQKVQAESSKANTTQFVWTAHRSASLSCVITDIQGTDSASSIDFNVKTIADSPPALELVSPATAVLATPRSVIPLIGEVSDDHALRDLTMVRSLVGFRDRAESIEQDLDLSSYTLEQKVDLGAIGVLPEQTLEFYIEATDKNPSLLGISTSNVVRVHIISMDEYAKRIRLKTTLQAFGERFRLLRELIGESKQSLLDIQTANQNADEEAYNKALDAAKKAHKASSDLAYKLAREFHAYSLEESLGDLAAETSDKLTENFLALHNLSYYTPAKEKTKRLNEMIERLGGVQEKSEELQKVADKVNAAARAMQLAVRFKQIYENQRSVAMRLTTIAKEINKGITRNTRQLPNLAKVQQRNKDKLERLLKDSRLLSESLPDEFVNIKDALTEFADKAEQLDIPEPMLATSDAAKAGQSIEASSQANLALQLMQQLLELKKANTDEPNLFAQMCQGRLQRNKLPVPPNAEDTLKNMLEAMMAKVQKPNGGQGGQGGGGMHANGEGGIGGGVSADGQSSSDFPMYGPERLNFGGANLAGDQGLAAKSRGRGPRTAHSSRLKQNKSQPSEAEKLNFNRIPEKYKDSVKKFQTL